MHWSQRNTQQKYKGFCKPRRKYLAGWAKKKQKPSAQRCLGKREKNVAADRLRTHGGKVCTSSGSGLAAAMKRDLTAWIKAERIARGLGPEIAQLPVGDWTWLAGPRFKGPVFHRHAEAKDKARGCEKKVRENEHVNYELPALFLSGPLETIRLDPRCQDLLELSVLIG